MPGVHPIYGPFLKTGFKPVKNRFAHKYSERHEVPLGGPVFNRFAIILVTWAQRVDEPLAGPASSRANRLGNGPVVASIEGEGPFRFFLQKQPNMRSISIKKLTDPFAKRFFPECS